MCPFLGISLIALLLHECWHAATCELWLGSRMHSRGYSSSWLIRSHMMKGSAKLGLYKTCRQLHIAHRCSTGGSMVDSTACSGQQDSHRCPGLVGRSVGRSPSSHGLGLTQPQSTHHHHPEGQLIPKWSPNPASQDSREIWMSKPAAANAPLLACFLCLGTLCSQLNVPRHGCLSMPDPGLRQKCKQPQCLRPLEVATRFLVRQTWLFFEFAASPM